MEIMYMSICNRNYVNMDLTVPFAIYIIFSVIIK